MSDNPREKIERAFVEGIGVDTNEDFESLEYGKHEKWDSVAHMNLVANLESEFDIMLETDDVIDMSSFKEAIRILSKYGVEIAS